MTRVDKNTNIDNLYINIDGQSLQGMPHDFSWMNTSVVPSATGEKRY
jgi:hypothetical protein